MGVKWKTKIDKLPEMTATTEALCGRIVKVGSLEGENAWLAGIHEYGCTITAKKAKYLTVPLCSEAAGRKAGSFSDLFVYTSASGKKFLARDEGDSLKLMYWLTPSVKIPERSFLRNGHDANYERIITQTERALSVVLSGKMTIDQMLDLYGQQMATAIKLYMRDLRTPPNSPITQAVKGDDNPLIGKTNSLHDSITWRKE